ncbi:MAG: MaoC family dehydratase N-terminal domain-containing protein, partial [Acidimicrobiales bacterium]
MTDAPPTFRERLDACVGQPVGAGVTVAPDPVNQPMIRHWAAAFEDDNPVYTDPDAAAASRHGQIVAPPL